MNFQNPKIEKALLTLVYVLMFVVIAYVSITLFVQATDHTADSLYREGRDESMNNYLPEMPEHLDFCGERVPLEHFDVREDFERELIKVAYWHSETFIYIKRAARYFPMISKILKDNGVPQDFLYLCVTESGMDHVVSPANAVGFWQILESTGKENGLEINSEVDERYKIENATVVACKYFKQAYAKFGSWTMAAASYNCGQAGLQRQVNNQGQDTYYDLRLNRETSRYIHRILAFKLILQHPEKYGFIYREKDLYQPIETVEVEVDTAITDLYAFGRDHAGTYKMLKLLNPWLRDTKLTNRDGKLYTIKVPAEGARDKSAKK
ncbi:MAG: lytic transglycosylase domain-containing protein [Bacteroidales bacterium]|nr:lytic transglycosylase domain-containing protein [Bacteroidales bacterium]